ncbi:MAG TPA: DUF4278 domain-containing protein [Xenococcaceae cyanobacterium]
MKLHFHGSTYDTPHTEWNVTEGKIIGKYRGKPLRSHVIAEQHRQRHHASELVYRGVHYTKG